MSELIAIGNRAFVVALAGVGAEPVRCENGGDFVNALRKVALQRDAKLVFVPESLALAAPEAVAAFRNRSAAALLPLPLLPSEAHPSLEQIRFLVEQATGASLI